MFISISLLSTQHSACAKDLPTWSSMARANPGRPLLQSAAGAGKGCSVHLPMSLVKVKGSRKIIKCDNEALDLREFIAGEEAME